jgi:hypothetical protein
MSTMTKEMCELAVAEAEYKLARANVALLKSEKKADTLATVEEQYKLAKANVVLIKAKSRVARTYSKKEANELALAEAQCKLSGTYVDLVKARDRRNKAKAMHLCSVKDDNEYAIAKIAVEDATANFASVEARIAKADAEETRSLAGAWDRFTRECEQTPRPHAPQPRVPYKEITPVVHLDLNPRPVNLVRLQVSPVMLHLMQLNQTKH